MKTLLAILLPLVVLGCAPKAKPVYLEPHPRTVDVVESVQSIRPGIDRASEKVSTLKGEARILADQASKARQDAEAATREAKRLADQGTASKAELDGMWKSLQAVTTRNLFLETELGKKEAALDAIRADLDEARQAASDALVKASKAEQAQVALADSVNSGSNRIKELEGELKTEQKAHAATKSALASLHGRARLYLLASGILAAWQIFKLVVLKRL